MKLKIKYPILTWEKYLPIVGGLVIFMVLVNIGVFVTQEDHLVKSTQCTPNYAIKDSDIDFTKSVLSCKNGDEFTGIPLDSEDQLRANLYRARGVSAIYTVQYTKRFKNSSIKYNFFLR
jgi:hypothetical protein